MAGCFNNQDQYREEELNRYLEGLDYPYKCPNCFLVADADKFQYDQEIDKLICPVCQNKIEL